MAVFSNPLLSARTSAPLIVGALLLYGGYLALSPNDPEWYADQLQIYGIQTEDLDNAAVRLRFIHSSIERNPPFSLAGTDLNTFQHALAELTVLQHDFAELQETARSQRLVHALYPLAFLQVVHDAEASRRVFIESESENDLETYFSTIDEMIALYHADAHRFRRALVRAVPPDAKAYAAGPYVISRASLLDTSLMLDARFSALQSRVDALRNCAQGGTEACDATQLALPRIADISTIPVTNNDLAHGDAARRLYAEKHVPARSASDTTFVLNTSRCLSPDSKPLFATIELGQGHPLFPDTRYVGAVGDMRFINTERMSPTIEHFAFYREKGVRVVPVGEMNYYECPYVERDAGTVLALEAIRSFVDTKDLSTRITDTRTRQRLSELESSLKQHIVYESDAVDYLSLLLTESETSALKEVQGEILELVHEYQYASSGFDATLASISIFTRPQVTRHRADIPSDLSAASLFLIRSANLTLSLGGNGSIGVPLSSFPRRNTNADPFVFLSSLLDTMSLQEILDDVRLYYSLTE